MKALKTIVAVFFLLGAVAMGLLALTAKPTDTGTGELTKAFGLDKPPAPPKDYKQLYLGAYGRWIKLNLSQGSHTDVCEAAKQMVEYAEKWDDHATVVEARQYLRESDCG